MPLTLRIASITPATITRHDPETMAPSEEPIVNILLQPPPGDGSLPAIVDSLTVQAKDGMGLKVGSEATLTFAGEAKAKK